MRSAWKGACEWVRNCKRWKERERERDSVRVKNEMGKERAGIAVR